MTLISKQEQAATGRFEFKYRISNIEYNIIRNAITPYMKADYFTNNAGNRGYFVRSLYYETRNYNIYSQKMAGDCSRVKYRLRSYCENPDNDMKIRVELKVRRGESLSKYQTFVSLGQYYDFKTYKYWNDDNDPVLEEFARGVHLLDLQPSVLVDYFREGYESRFNDGIRLTFDHGVQSARSKDLFPEKKPFFKVHHSYEVVLEIKFRGKLPFWLKKIIKGYGLRLVANSKFTQGIEVGTQDRFYPNGILIVR